MIYTAYGNSAVMQYVKIGVKKFCDEDFDLKDYVLNQLLVRIKATLLNHK